MLLCAAARTDAGRPTEKAAREEDGRTVEAPECLWVEGTWRVRQAATAGCWWMQEFPHFLSWLPAQHVN